MTLYTSHTTDGIDLLVSPVTFAASAAATTLVGGVVAAYAKNASTGTVYAATTCTVASATSVRAKWAALSLPAGKYDVQVFATPTGYAIQTIASIDVTVLAAAGP